MLYLLGAPRTRAHRVMWMLEELGCSYEQHSGFAIEPGSVLGVATAELLDANGNGKVPALIDEDLVIWESLAINLHLAMRRDSSLSPRSSTEWATALQWSFWVVNEIEGILVAIRELQRETESDSSETTLEAAIQDATLRLRRPLSVLDRVLSESPTLCEGRFTVVDLNVASVIALAGPAGVDLSVYPAVSAWFTRCASRPAAQKVLKAAARDMDQDGGRDA